MRDAGGKPALAKSSASFDGGGPIWRNQMQSQSKPGAHAKTRPYSPQRSSTQEKNEASGAPTCEQDPAPRVPEGEYLASCKTAHKYQNPRFKREEIVLQFVLCDCKCAGTTLCRYYSATTAGKPRSNYKREWVIANQGIPPQRGDRMPYKKFMGKLFRVRVNTVTTDAYQEKLPPSLQYSKVGAILELVQTNEQIV